MDNSGWSWPAWKFGMKREELFTTIHDQYNTFSSPIQDPDAFHHDVYEISTVASDAKEFHHLMAQRKEQRLRELNESLELASLEIIANPSLVGTARWEMALQLFRTKSFDSLVRYFSSYIPVDHPWPLSKDDDLSSCPDSDICHSRQDSSLSCRTAKTGTDFYSITPYPDQLPDSPESLAICFSDDSDSEAADTTAARLPSPLSQMLPSSPPVSEDEHDDDSPLSSRPDTPVSSSALAMPEPCTSAKCEPSIWPRDDTAVENDDDDYRPLHVVTPTDYAFGTSLAKDATTSTSHPTDTTLPLSVHQKDRFSSPSFLSATSALDPGHLSYQRVSSPPPSRRRAKKDVAVSRQDHDDDCPKVLGQFLRRRRNRTFATECESRGRVQKKTMSPTQTLLLRGRSRRRQRQQ